MPFSGKISPLTIQRLSLYLRVLKEYAAMGKVAASSGEIAEATVSTAAQVRKDLSYFGSFGKKGQGYNIDELIEAIEGILGLDRRWKVALVGLGKIGQSLIQFKEFGQIGFDFVAIFEKDPEKIGKSFNGIPIYHIDEMPRVCEEETILIALVAVPAESSEEVFQRVLDAGIRGILNLSGRCCFKPPPHAFIKNVNVAAEIESLSYYLTHF